MFYETEPKSTADNLHVLHASCDQFKQSFECYDRKTVFRNPLNNHFKKAPSVNNLTEMYKRMIFCVYHDSLLVSLYFAISFLFSNRALG